MKGDECKERAVNLGKLMGNGFERACNIANGLDGVRKNRQDFPKRLVNLHSLPVAALFICTNNRLSSWKVT